MTADTVRAVLDGLYTRLLLRDIFGKIVPGSFFLLAAAAAIWGAEPALGFLANPGFLAGLASVGASWLAGFCVQALGEKCVRAWTYPPALQRKPALVSEFDASLDGAEMGPDTSDMARQAREELSGIREFYGGEANPYGRKANLEWMFAGCLRKSLRGSARWEQDHERFVVIKEAMGNLAMAVMVSTVVGFLGYVSHAASARPVVGVVLHWAVVVSLVAFLAWSSFYMHGLHVWRQALHTELWGFIARWHPRLFRDDSELRQGGKE